MLQQVPTEDAAAIIKNTSDKYGYRTGDGIDIAKLKEEILNRPPIEMTPEKIALEKSLAKERQETLARRLQTKHG